MSTRRARIKAVAALPQRRKNVDANKKKQEEKDGFETDAKSVSSQESFKKTCKPDEVTTQDHKDKYELRVSPTKRRLSDDKSQGQLHLSIDKTGTAKDNETKTPRANCSSVDRTPKRHSSVDETPAKRISTETSLQNSEKSDSQNVQTDLSAKKSETNKSDTNWFSNTRILQNLLDGSETSKSYQSPFSKESSTENISECRQSTSSDHENVSRKTMCAPFFASPRSRASPRKPSPIVRTPIIAVDLIAEKLIAPHKGPNSVNSEINFITENINLKGNKNDVEVIIERLPNKDDKSKPDVPAKSIKIIDEYIINPINETSTVMDGIVPLQSVSKAPKPLDLLKNEIISENAEVLFDPIVPLPSPSKVRPKLRPMPRLGPRRNSLQQGSASESEDENRRLHGRPATPATPLPPRQRHDSHSHPIVQRDVARVRNDSVCSTVSQGPSQAAAVSSPLREREKSLKTRREEMAARRNAALRRRQTKVERDKLTMYDLIFYNPTANPIIPDQDEINAKEANKKDEERKAESKRETVTGEAPTSPEPAPAAVPQIKLGPNGEIILDEQSLVVNQSDQRKIDTVVREGAWGGAGSRAYRRTPRTADWSDAETVRFYRALATMGTDFTLMQPLFPARSRRELKQKFKKEERLNLAQIDMALRSGAKWDPSRLETEFTKERKAAEVAAEKAKERQKKEKEKQRQLREQNVRRSCSSKTLGDSNNPQTNSSTKIPSTLDEYLAQPNDNRKQKQSRKRQQDPSPSVTSPYATLTRVAKDTNTKLTKKTPVHDMATITTINKETLPTVPPNIEKGSLVVLTVNDPQSPSRKMLQTYIAQGPGNLTPVSLPANFLNSVVGFMKKSNSPVPSVSSPKTRSKTPNILSPRKRTSSYTITQL